MGWTLRSGKLPLVNQRTEPTPPNVRQPGERVMRSPLITEIDDERATLHRAHVDESPIARILGIVPVVAQHEILVHRDAKRAPGIARRMIAAALLDRGHEILALPTVGGRHEILALPVELGIESVVQWILTLHVRLLQRAAVDVHLPDPHFDDVTRRAD